MGSNSFCCPLPYSHCIHVAGTRRGDKDAIQRRTTHTYCIDTQELEKLFPKRTIRPNALHEVCNCFPTPENYPTLQFWWHRTPVIGMNMNADGGNPFLRSASHFPTRS